MIPDEVSTLIGTLLSHGCWQEAEALSKIEWELSWQFQDSFTLLTCQCQNCFDIIAESLIPVMEQYAIVFKKLQDEFGLLDD